MIKTLRTSLATAINRVRKPKEKELTEEISAPGLAGVRQVWHESLGALTPARLEQILDAAAQGDAYDYLTLAEEMEERDLHYASVLGTRKLALVGLDVRVDSYSDDVADIRRADAVREIVADDGFGDLVAHMVDALGKSYAVSEIIWDRSDSVWRPTFAERDARLFRWDRETGRDLRLLDEADPFNGIALPPYKFVVHTPKIRSGLPIRGGLARLAAVAYMCKAWTWRDWMTFADIYGLPMRVGKYGPSASKEDISTLMAAVANLGSDAAAVLPDSMRIEFQQAVQTAGAGDFFQKLAEFWDKQISKGVLGQTMTADDGASLSQAEVHQTVRLDIMTADARALSNTLQRDVVKPFCDLNFGGGPYPRLHLLVPKPENTELLVNALGTLVPLGLDVEQSVIRDRLGLPDPDPDSDVLRPAVSLPAFNRALNAEVRTPDYVTELAGQMAAQADGAVDAWAQRIQAEAAAATSYDDLLGRLSMLLPELPLDELASAMTDGFSTAALAGQSDVMDDSHA